MTLTAAPLLLLVLALAGCTPEPVETPAPTPVSTSSTTAAPTGSTTAAPVVEPVETPLPADFLLEHADAEPDLADEMFHYGFYTDETTAIRCDVWIGGQSDPYIDCFVRLDYQSRVTYTVPPITDSDCWDGYEVSLVSIPLDAGYARPRAAIVGCESGRPYPTVDIAAATTVLPDGSVLEMGPFVCTMDATVVTCADASIAASISIGLSRIAVTN